MGSLTPWGRGPHGIVDPESKDFLEKYTYGNVVTWGHSASSFVIVTGNLVKQTKVYFKTDQAEGRTGRKDGRTGRTDGPGGRAIQWSCLFLDFPIFE